MPQSSALIRKTVWSYEKLVSTFRFTWLYSQNDQRRHERTSLRFVSLLLMEIHKLVLGNIVFPWYNSRRHERKQHVKSVKPVSVCVAYLLHCVIRRRYARPFLSVYLLHCNIKKRYARLFGLSTCYILTQGDVTHVRLSLCYIVTWRDVLHVKMCTCYIVT
jgi:hypothetical protein